MFSKKKSPHTGACLVLHLVVGLLLLLAAVAAGVGVVMAHKLGSDAVFGTTVGSLALIAFSVTVGVFLKQLKCCVTKCEVCNGK